MCANVEKLIYVAFYVFRNISMGVALTPCASKQSTVCKPSIRRNSQQCLPIMPPVLFPKRLWACQAGVMHDFEGSSDVSSHTDVCAKSTLLKEAERQSIDGIQKESNTGNDGERDQKTCAKWASRKPCFASSLLHSYSTALLSFLPPQFVTGSNTQHFYWASVFFRGRFWCVLKAIYNSVPE